MNSYPDVQDAPRCSFLALLSAEDDAKYMLTAPGAPRVRKLVTRMKVSHWNFQHSLPIKRSSWTYCGTCKFIHKKY